MFVHANFKPHAKFTRYWRIPWLTQIMKAFWNFSTLFGASVKQEVSSFGY